MTNTALSAQQEWRTYWPLVLASMIGFSFHSVTTYSIGLFITPLHNEFGWGRAEITGGLTIAALMTIPLSPVLGIAIDRWGSRRLAIPGLILTAMCISAFSLANGSITQWLALWTIYTIMSLGIKATMWTAAVSSVFSSGRGLALAVTLSGTPIAQILAPPLSHFLIDSYGWRASWVWLGIGWCVPALVLSLFFLFDAHDEHRIKVKAGSTDAKAVLPGLSLKEAIRNVPLLRIAASTVIMMVLAIGVIVHQVPILTEVGVSRQNAAFLASLAGFAGIVGKLITGFLLDRYHSSWIGGLSIGIASVGFVLLLETIRTPALIVVAMIIIGYAAGCKLQICAYLTSRYAGMKNFGKVFGVMFSLIAMGSGMGPLLAGATYDVFGSYGPLIMGGIPASLIAGLLLVGLGPYPQWTDSPENPAMA